MAGSLKSGNTKACGCLHKTHGMSEHPLYSVWGQMKERCQKPTNQAYKNYGGRGISVCERWESFENFLFDIGIPPKGLTLERMDNDGNYEPGNCKWATRSEQRANQRKHFA